jgi:hypothetical protein
VTQRAATNRHTEAKQHHIMDDDSLRDWYFSERTGKIPVQNACTVDKWGGTMYDCTPAQVQRAHEINDREWAEYEERSRRQIEIARKAAVLGAGVVATTGGPATAVPGGATVILLGGSMSVCGSASVTIGAPLAASGEACIAVDSHGVGTSGGRKATGTKSGTGWEASVSLKASTANVAGLGGGEWSVNAGQAEVGLSDDGNMSVGRTVGTRDRMMGGGGPGVSRGEADSGYLFSWGDLWRWATASPRVPVSLDGVGSR